MNLKTTISSVRYKKEAVNGSFFVILQTASGCCKGFMRWEPVEGERVNLVGEYEIYKGERQFKFNSAAPDIPDDPRARLHYVCEIAAGIGPATEELVWETWGAKWEESAEPGVVKGLSGAKWEAFRDARGKLSQNQAQVQVITWCLSKGMTWNQADRAWETWKADTMAVVSADPYKISELPRYGYTDADKVARSAFGIQEHDQRRIKAGIRYLMAQICEGGSTVVSWSRELLPKATTLFGIIYEDEIIEAAADMMRSGALVGFDDDDTLATAEAHRAEMDILDFIKEHSNA